MQPSGAGGTVSDALLAVEDLRTHFAKAGRVLKAVDGLSFTLSAGRVLGIVGESGSGKTVTALSILRLIDPPGKIAGGRVLYRGRDLLALPESQMERIRGDRIAMIFQDPMTSLNPAFAIGDQIAEGMVIHHGTEKGEAKRRAIELMSLVGIPHPAARYDDYPHQFSGGMRQRALIAAAIACRPDILIADEPTTALDVTIQAQILKLLSRVQQELKSALVLVTHDLGVVAAMADEVMVMYAGRMVEYSDVATLFTRPLHPYTQGLMQSIIRLDDRRDTPFRPIPGTPPDLSDLPSGCSFRSRCPHAMARCAAEAPLLRPAAAGHRVACHLVEGGR
jgi:oligopeptide/dipeptide ABC transporter ATP-binding protein